MGLFYFARDVVPHHVLMIIIGGDKGNLGMLEQCLNIEPFLYCDGLRSLSSSTQILPFNTNKPSLVSPTKSIQTHLRKLVR